MKKVVFTFGRYNPPTTGHAELITYAVRLAQRTGADHRIYTSLSHDPSKNPLSPQQKVSFLRQIFPGVNFIADPSMKTAFAICKKLAEEGYEDVAFVVGDDRVAEFKTQLGKYVKPRTAKDFDPKKHYPFKKFQVVSSGARKQGISGTDLRAAVRKGDFATFAKASAARDKTLARKIFAATRTQLKEEVEINELTSREMHKHLTSKGWSLDRKGKSHDLYTHPQSKGRRITLPRHPGELDRRLQKEIDKQTDRYIREEKGLSRRDFHDKLMSFVDFTCNHLGIDDKPTIQYKEDGKEGCQPSFASYSPGDKVVSILTKNRHPMDVFRSVAHELVHHKQNLDGRLGKNIAKEGATGSKIENEANSEAGKVMRYFGSENPFYFDMQYVTEQEKLDELDIKTIGNYRKYAKPEYHEYRKYYTFNNEKDKEFVQRKVKNRAQGIDRADDRMEKWKEAQKPTPGQKRAAIWARKREMKKSQTNEDRAIILSGTPGSGKDKILKEAILPFGFTEVSADNFHRESIKGNLVINGTSDYNTIKTIKEALDLKGYNTIMVFVNTSNVVSKQRNEARALKGGRVIIESIRFAKWKDSQTNLNNFDELFERVIEVKNDLDLNQSERVIKETYEKLINAVSKDIEYFILNENDRRFENMLNEVGGAGNWGTSQLTDRYKADTPGQEPGGFTPMKVMKMKKEEKKPQSTGLQISADRIGQEAGFPKSPGLGTPFDDFSIGISPSVINDPVGRWMVKEETRRLFKQKYGKLAEQKIRETAEKLKRTQKESLIDPYIGAPGVTPNAGNVENVRPDPNAEDEKLSLFGKKKYKNTKYRRNK